MLLYFLHENRYSKVFSIVLNLNMIFLNYQRRKEINTIYISKKKILKKIPLKSKEVSRSSILRIYAFKW